MGQIYDLTLFQDRAPTMADSRRTVPPCNSFLSKTLQQSNWTLPVSSKLLPTAWRNGVTSWKTTVRRSARVQYVVTLPRQQEVAERRAPVVKAPRTANLTAAASIPFSFLISNASVERVLFLMTDQRKRCCEQLLKSQIQVKTNFEYSC